MTSEREAEKRAFLRREGLRDACRQPLAGDASTRAYERLRPTTGGSLILMDQVASLESPPCPAAATPRDREALGYNARTRLAAGRVDAFIAVAGWLRRQGLSAPRVIAADVGAGLAVLEDLGDDLYARVIADGGDEAALYAAAADVLVRLHATPVPDLLQADGCEWPLLSYDAVALGAYTDLFLEWLPRLNGGRPPPAEGAAAWEAIWAPVKILAEAGARVFCHRDFHAENLIWAPERQGVARVGLLDFQDAVRAHPAWDLSMLLHDARRDVTPEREAAVLTRYLAQGTQLDAEAFRADFRTLGAINIVRMLGLFARLATRDGKSRYRALMPRLWRYLDNCLRAGAAPGLRGWLDAYLPGETRA